MAHLAIYGFGNNFPLESWANLVVEHQTDEALFMSYSAIYEPLLKYSLLILYTIVYIYLLGNTESSSWSKIIIGNIK